MPIPHFTLSLGGLMWAVATAALVMALPRSPMGCLLAIPAFQVYLVRLVARLGRMSQTRAAVWVCGFYPWQIVLAIHATWGVAWWTLGHRPDRTGALLPPVGNFVDFCNNLTFILYLGLPFSLLTGGLILALCEAYPTMDEAAPGPPGGVIRLILLPPILWLGAFAVIAADPIRSYGW